MAEDTDPWQASAIYKAKKRPPWFPSAEDGRFMLEAAAPALANAGANAKILVLGVTPEIVQLDWRGAGELIAADSSDSMVDALWQPNPLLHSRVIRNDWSTLPLPDQSIAVITGDGSLNAISAFEGYDGVLRELARVLRPDGALIIRFFMKRRPAVNPEAVVEAAMQGAFPSTASFRMAFLMALAGDDADIAFSDALTMFERLVPDRETLARATGWPRSDIDLVDTDRGSPIRLTFPAEHELRQKTDPWFELTALRYGTYTQASSCPTLVFRRRHPG